MDIDLSASDEISGGDDADETMQIQMPNID